MADVTRLPDVTVVGKTPSSAPKVVKVNTNPFAGVTCTIEVYPFEGGSEKHILTGGQILSCTVNKTRDGSGGTFTVVLAPGGPLGTEGSPTWSEIITPMSLILIGMQRGDAAAIVLIGVVRNIGESQTWSTNDAGSSSSVQRGQSIHGEDFSYYFLTQNYAALTVFGVSSGTLFGAATGIPPSLALANSVSQGTIGGTQDTPSNPSEVAQAWYELMVGSKGMMSKSFVPYKPAGSRLKVFDVFKRIWEDYPASIPMATPFLAVEGSWMAKFQDILPWPWYELFITTAPVDAYEETFKKGKLIDGKEFTMESMPLAKPAGPVVVARVNPIPVLNNEATLMGSTVTLGTINVDRWSKLITYDLTDAGFISSRIGFSVDEAKNVYMINPVSVLPRFGISNSNTSPSWYLFTMFGDPASIHRYGYRPYPMQTFWWFDQNGIFAEDPAKGLAQGIADCTVVGISQYHPTPFMARGSVTIPLQPDILQGNVFRYRPFKSSSPDQGTWDFYVDSVQHSFTFGGRSATTLNLSRGLPSSVYADTKKGGVLESIWKGDARREGGRYLSGLPKDTGPALMSVEVTNESVSAFLGAVGQAYVTPGQ
jgi:hypothetical protein